MQPVANWNLFSGDVRDFDYSTVAPGVDLIAGGPPCQPFSLGGKHGAHQDERDMFPEAVRAVRELKPRAFIVENVKGLLRESFSKYFGYVQLQLSYPEVTKRPGEEWEDHLSRLERHHTSGSESGLFYRVVFRLLNAANYGVPQKRERVFIVGFRGDLNLEWSFPKATHNAERLLWEQWATGEYWERHSVATKHRPTPAPATLARVAKLKNAMFETEGKAWLTARDAFAGLPDPETAPASAEHLNHVFVPGARSYVGHTGSSLDEPAKTLKAGAHGVPGGENMLLKPCGAVRYFTVRESARLQTFPDNYLFPVTWGESMRQLGNAVPVELAHAVADSVAARLNTTKGTIAQ